MLTTAGRGQYCGVMLHVWNPEGNWWGEGDEKFFVDGEKVLSISGTGTDDYLDYAWRGRYLLLFAKSYYAQTIAEGKAPVSGKERDLANRGHISVNRWHLADNVPFQQSLGRFCYYLLL